MSELTRDLMINEQCNRFEQEWKSGRRPVIEEFLRGVSDEIRPELSRALLDLDVHFRKTKGDEPQPADYETVLSPTTTDEFFTDSSDDGATMSSEVKGMCKTAWQDFKTAWHRGDNPQVREYCKEVQEEHFNDFLDELVRGGQLTKYQVDNIRAGESGSLIVEKYEIREVIGEGGMGKVFKVRHKRLGDTEFAMKMISPRKQMDSKLKKRFRREARIAASLQDPNIVRTHDAGLDHNEPFVVMEYINGCDLGAHGGPLKVDVAVNYTLQAARGLAAIHKKKIVHRDIKPSNLMLDNSNPEQPVVKILDLGLAVRRDEDKSQQITLTGERFGSVHTMSPEQFKDSRKVDARSDIYSLGCTLYYLLTGCFPFEGKSLAARIEGHTNTEAPPLREKCPDATRRLGEIVDRMLAEEPDDRQQSMAAVIDELECCFENVSSYRCAVTGKTAEFQFEKEGCYVCKFCGGTIRYQDGVAQHNAALRYRCPATKHFARIPGEVSDEEDLSCCTECDNWVLVRKWRRNLYVFHWVEFEELHFFGFFKRLYFCCPQTRGETSVTSMETRSHEMHECTECGDEVVVHRHDDGLGIYHQVEHREYPAKPV